ncbi:hypothetical protein H6F73_06355 [Microcoleus sp. FACHB-68]|nr:hypothetical protein [Microcoleus sp. FACHB-68]
MSKRCLFALTAQLFAIPNRNNFPNLDSLLTATRKVPGGGAGKQSKNNLERMPVKHSPL